MNEKIIWLIILLLYSPVLYQLVAGIIKFRNELIPRIRKFILYFIAISFPLIIVLAILNRTNYLDYEAPIPYSRIDDISFKNFRGLEFINKTFKGNSRYAYIVTTMEYEITGQDVYIEAFFHPSMSYVYNSHSDSKELLTHELYHFRITEAYSRMAKKQISELKNYSADSAEIIIDRIMIELNDFQSEYDYNTYHSYVYSEQKKYETHIDSLLQNFNVYQNSKLFFNVKN